MAHTRHSNPVSSVWLGSLSQEGKLMYSDVGLVLCRMASLYVHNAVQFIAVTSI